VTLAEVLARSIPPPGWPEIQSPYMDRLIAAFTEILGTPVTQAQVHRLLYAHHLIASYPEPE
jgi:hypothetical protein